MAPVILSGAVWGYFPAWVRKWLHEASLEYFGVIFWAGFGKGSRGGWRGGNGHISTLTSLCYGTLGRVSDYHEDLGLERAKVRRFCCGARYGSRIWVWSGLGLEDVDCRVASHPVPGDWPCRIAARLCPSGACVAPEQSAWPCSLFRCVGFRSGLLLCSSTAGC
eukprot:11341298-Karenia_brevis.AAC.1